MYGPEDKREVVKERRRSKFIDVCASEYSRQISVT